MNKGEEKKIHEIAVGHRIGNLTVKNRSLVGKAVRTALAQFVRQVSAGQNDDSPVQKLRRFVDALTEAVMIEIRES